MQSLTGKLLKKLLKLGYKPGHTEDFSGGIIDWLQLDLDGGFEITLELVPARGFAGKDRQAAFQVEIYHKGLVDGLKFRGEDLLALHRQAMALIQPLSEGLNSGSN